MSIAPSPSGGPTTDRYFDGKRAIAYDVKPVLFGELIEIRPAGGGAALARWPIAALEVLDQNKVNGALTIVYRAEPDARLILFDNNFRAALLAGRPDLSRWRAKRRQRAARGIAIWGGIGAALVLGVIFGWRSAAGALVDLMPPAWETRLGQSVRDVIVGRSACEDDAAQEALDRLTARLRPDDLPGGAIRIELVDSDVVNAMALPGNHILVFRGLIAKAEGPEQLAGVVAHEMAHLVYRHPMQGAIQQLGLQAVMTMVFGGSDAGGLAGLMTALSYTREMEREADILGLQLMEEAGMRADGLARFFLLLEADESGGATDDAAESQSGDGEPAAESESSADDESWLRLSEWLSTHPDLAERAAMSARPATGDAPMSDADWAALRQACATAE